MCQLSRVDFVNIEAETKSTVEKENSRTNGLFWLNLQSFMQTKDEKTRTRLGLSDPLQINYTLSLIRHQSSRQIADSIEVTFFYAISMMLLSH